MAERSVQGPEQPRVEPEIIPPGDPRMREGVFTHRVYVARIGPVGFFALVLSVALLAAVFLVLMLGAFLLWIPIAGLILAVAIISSFLRRRG